MKVLVTGVKGQLGYDVVKRLNELNIEAKGKTSSDSDGLGNIFDMDFGDLSEGDSEWAIINIIRNLIAKFKSFLQQLIETFQSIGG